MTALPKHWPSSRRQGRRRAAQVLTLKDLPQTVNCKHCGQPKRPHFVCSNCNQ